MLTSSIPAREPLPTRVNGLEQLPASYTAILEAALPALGAEIPAPCRIAIDDHVRLLLAWNRAINLSGIREAEAVAREHVLDSLAALPLLRRAGIDEFLDLGSGGGFPGLPLAIALPAKRAVLVESVAKKARFLETVVAALEIGPWVGVALTRAEELAADPSHRGHWQAVVSRAVADLTELSELALPLLLPRGILVAWKRLPLDEELDRARRAVTVMGGRVAACEAVTLPGLEDHALVVVEKVAATPASFPRDPATRRRRPL